MTNIDELKSTGLKATLPRLKILEIFLAAQAVPDGLRAGHARLALVCAG